MGASGGKTVHAGHREHMRRRFAADGMSFDSFEDHELLEMLLFGCYRRRNTNEIAHALLGFFSCTEAMLKAHEERLCEIENVDISAARQMRFYGALLDMAAQFAEPVVADITDSARLCRILRAAELKGEVTAVIYETENGALGCRAFKADETLYEAPENALRHIVPRCKGKLVTIRCTARPEDISLMQEMTFAAMAAKFAAVNQLEHTDHCIFDGQELCSLGDMELI